MRNVGRCAFACLKGSTVDTDPTDPFWGVASADRSRVVIECQTPTIWKKSDGILVNYMKEKEE